MEEMNQNCKIYFNQMYITSLFLYLNISAGPFTRNRVGNCTLRVIYSIIISTRFWVWLSLASSLELSAAPIS